MKRIKCSDKIFYSYCAGIIDSDGTVVIERQKRKEGVYLAGRVAIGQVTETVPRMFYDNFGGNLRLKPPSGMGKQYIWYWQLSNSWLVKAFLNKIAPYMRIKKSKAEEVLRVIICRTRSERAALASKSRKRDAKGRYI